MNVINTDKVIIEGGADFTFVCKKIPFAISRAETMVCFTAFSLKADQMPIFGLLLVFFLLKSLHFMNFPQNDN